MVTAPAHGITTTRRTCVHEVNASIIQGSGIGPVMYVVSAADLHTVTPGNSLVKYADDTYLVIPALNVDTRDIEIANVDTWSQLSQQPHVKPREVRRDCLP